MQKCARTLPPRDQKFGVRRQDFQQRSSAQLIFLSAVLWQSLYMCAAKIFCAQPKLTETFSPLN